MRFWNDVHYVHSMSKDKKVKQFTFTWEQSTILPNAFKKNYKTKVRRNILVRE